MAEKISAEDPLHPQDAPTWYDEPVGAETF